MRLRRQAPHQIGFNAGRPGRPRGARAAHGLCHDGRGPQGSRSRPGRFEGPGRAQAAGRPASQARETRLNYYSSPICVRLVYSPSNACPRPAGACIVPPRAAPQSVRPREPREPDTAEDAGGQTDHLGQAYKGGLRKKRFFHKPPSFMNSLNPFVFKLTKSLFGRRVRSWLRTNAGGAPNTCKSRG